MQQPGDLESAQIVESMAPDVRARACHDQADRGVASPASEMLDQVKGRRSRVVDLFEHDHQRLASGVTGQHAERRPRRPGTVGMRDRIPVPAGPGRRSAPALGERGIVVRREQRGECVGHALVRASCGLGATTQDQPSGAFGRLDHGVHGAGRIRSFDEHDRFSPLEQLGPVGDMMRRENAAIVVVQSSDRLGRSPLPASAARGPGEPRSRRAPGSRPGTRASAST